MTSYLNQFNYQIIQGGGNTIDVENSLDSNFIRVVFLHGLMGFGLNWRRIAIGLDKQFVSLLLDQRGHGKSIKPQSNYSPKDYAEDLEIICNELGWEKFCLVGHSMGGRNALMYAHLFPNRVSKLVIEDIGPEAKPDAITYYSGLIESIPTPFSSKLVAKQWLLNDFTKTSFGRSGGATLGQYLYANIIEAPDGKADWRFSKQAILETVEKGRAQDHWSEWESLTMPTLIIRGADSTDLSQPIFEEMLQRLPHAKGHVIKGARHWVHFDQPFEFIKVLQDFLTLTN